MYLPLLQFSLMSLSPKSKLYWHAQLFWFHNLPMPEIVSNFDLADREQNQYYISELPMPILKTKENKQKLLLDLITPR